MGNKLKHYIYDDNRNIGCVEYISHMGNDKTIANAARVSLGKDNNLPFSEKDEKLVKFLMDNGHTSPFEHCVLTCKFTVPLFVRSQHMRHRTWSFNETSRRYTSEGIQFYLPKSFRTQHDSNYQASNDDELINPQIEVEKFEMFDMGGFLADDAVEFFGDCALELYENMLKAGICREQARMVLPQNMYTSYWGSCSLHNMFGFLKQRLDKHAQYEIRVVAEALLSICLELYPVATWLFLDKNNLVSREENEQKL